MRPPRLLKPLDPTSVEDWRPKAPGYFISGFKYETFFTLVFLAGYVLFLLIVRFVGQSQLTDRIGGYAAKIAVISYFVLMPLFVHRAARHRSQSCFGFWDGLRYAFYDVMFLFADLPIVGFLFPTPKLGGGEDDENP